MCPERPRSEAPVNLFSFAPQKGAAQREGSESADRATERHPSHRTTAPAGPTAAAPEGRPGERGRAAPEQVRQALQNLLQPGRRPAALSAQAASPRPAASAVRWRVSKGQESGRAHAPWALSGWAHTAMARAAPRLGRRQCSGCWGPHSYTRGVRPQGGSWGPPHVEEADPMEASQPPPSGATEARRKRHPRLLTGRQGTSAPPHPSALAW